jgi:hypothetical protein
MPSIRSSEDFRLPGAYRSVGEHAAVLSDIRVAEEQIARGEGIEREAAQQQVLARLGQ